MFSRAMDDYEPEEDLKKCREIVSRFETSLPTRVDPASLSTSAKIPFKAVVLRETLLHRVTELAATATELYERKNRVISAFLITRAVHETTALLYWLYLRMNRVVDEKLIGDFDEFIMKLLFGWKKEEDDNLPVAFNILTAIEKLDKLLDGKFRRNYDFLSEFCHPNYSGVHGAYAKIDRDNIWADIGPEHTNVSLLPGLHILVVVLEIFEHYYNKTGDLLKPFIKLCEDDLAKKT